MKRAAYTIVELLVSIAVVIALAAVVGPVFQGALAHSKEKQCIGTLRNLGASIEMYRNDHDGAGRYGDWVAMGLPPDMGALMGVFSLPVVAVQCSIPGPQGDAKPPFFRYWDSLEESFDTPPWDEYAEKYKDDSVLLGCLNHSHQRKLRSSPYIIHKGLGLYVGGFARVKRGQGDPTRRIWWSQ